MVKIPVKAYQITHVSRLLTTIKLRPAFVGGIYSPDLKVNEVNFVIAGVASGDKVDAALTRKIPVLKVEWLHKSAETGYMAKIADYSILVRTSSPTSRTSGKSSSCLTDSPCLRACEMETKMKHSLAIYEGILVSINRLLTPSSRD
jgi:hypothetical protein